MTQDTNSLCCRFADLLLCDLRPVYLMGAVCGVISALALARLSIMVPESHTSVYLVVLDKLMPLWFWAFCFAVYASARFMNALRYRAPVPRHFTPILGMSLWMSVLAAGTVLRDAPSGLAILYAVPATFEVWALAQESLMHRRAQDAKRD